MSLASFYVFKLKIRFFFLPFFFFFFFFFSPAPTKTNKQTNKTNKTKEQRIWAGVSQEAGMVGNAIPFSFWIYDLRSK